MKLPQAGLQCALLTGQERLGPENASHVTWIGRIYLENQTAKAIV